MPTASLLLELCSFRLSSSGSRDSRICEVSPSPYSSGGSAPPLAGLVVVGEFDLSGGLVVQRHIGDVGVERLAHPLADQLDQRVEVELRGERLPDAVHRRELGHPLARLVDETGVVERDAEAAGERGQQPLVGLARRRASGRRSGARSRRSRGRRRRAGRRAPTSPAPRSAHRVAVRSRHLRRDLVDQQRLARLDHVLAEADQRDRLLVETLAPLDHVREAREARWPRRRPRCSRPERRRPPAACRRRGRRSPACRARRRSPPGRC